MSRFWPKHRYIVLSHDNSVQVVMNAEDHLDIIASSKYGKLTPILESIHGVYAIFQQKCRFYENEQFGFLTVDPYRAGTGMKVCIILLKHLQISLPRLTDALICADHIPNPPPHAHAGENRFPLLLRHAQPVRSMEG